MATSFHQLDSVNGSGRKKAFRTDWFWFRSFSLKRLSARFWGLKAYIYVYSLRWSGMYIPNNYYVTIPQLGPWGFTFFIVFDNSTQNKRVHFIIFCLRAPKHHTEPLEVWACPWPTLSSKQPFPSLSRWRSNPPLDRFCHQTPWIWLRRPWPVWIQAMGRRHWSWNWGLAMSLGCKQKWRWIFWSVFSV